MAALTLDRAKELQAFYQPTKAIAETLHSKSLVMLVGPVAAGKTRIINQVAHMNPGFGPVSTYTTREQRADDDPRLIKVVPHEKARINKLLAKIAGGGIVQYAIHPTSERFYWTEPRDYPYKYNLLATLSGVVETMSKLPFEKIHTVSLVCNPEIWQDWLYRRYPKDNEDRQKRLKEAIQSLEWLIDHYTKVMWIENIPNHPEIAARGVIDAVLHNKGEDKSSLAREMLEIARGE